MSCRTSLDYSETPAGCRGPKQSWPQAVYLRVAVIRDSGEVPSGFGQSWLGRRLRPPCALCQVVLVESLTDQRLDDGLTAHVKVLSSLIQFLQHAGCEIHIHALNRLNHAALALEETGNVLALIG